MLHHTREIIIFTGVIYRWQGTGNAGGPRDGVFYFAAALFSCLFFYQWWCGGVGGGGGQAGEGPGVGGRGERYCGLEVICFSFSFIIQQKLNTY